MAALTPASRSHLWRVIRLTAFTVATAPAVTALVHSGLERWPLLGAAIGVLEVIAHLIAPTAPPPAAATPAAAPPSNPHLS